MVAYVAESAASAPPPRGLPFAPPAARASGGGFTPPVLAGGAPSDIDEDAQPIFSSSETFTGDGEGPPLEDLESQMSGEVAERDRSSPVPKAGARGSASRAEDESESASAAELPDLDSLVARLPADVRETLDELFRARFIAVKRLPKKVFHAQAATGRT